MEDLVCEKESKFSKCKAFIVLSSFFPSARLLLFFLLIFLSFCRDVENKRTVTENCCAYYSKVEQVK